MAAAVLLLAGSARQVSAQPGPSPSFEALRMELDRLSSAPPPGIPEGTIRSIEYMVDVAARIAEGFPEQSANWRRKALAFIERARAGHDPFPEQRGKIVNRSHASRVSTLRQGYAIYLPPNYDPARSWPLMLVLHGGSSNGNLFLGVVLGNNMSWLQYNEFVWNDFEPRWLPNVIVVAPDGFGQVMWRWMGEEDVLSVMEDVKRHYNVDEDRVILAGLSNGGVGAYSIGVRHAWRFSVVQAIAGAPSWLQYAGGNPLPSERAALERYSGLHLIENSTNTDFRIYHGNADTGPMRPAYVSELERRMGELEIPTNLTWYEAGHDILYRVHRHGRTFDELGRVRRNRRPAEVRVVTGDYRANRQHWLTVTRIDDYPKLARVVARVKESTIAIDARGAQALSLDLRDVPLSASEGAKIEVNGATVYDGDRRALGHVIHLRRGEDGWRTGFPQAAVDSLTKRPGIAGPLTDIYYDRTVHVYGTQNPEQTDALREAAERGSKGWPVWLWRFRQEVMPDTAVTDEVMEDANLVLYGTAGSNAILERVQGRLPIRLQGNAVVLGGERFEGDDVGVRFIHPNPLCTSRYLVVQAGVTPEAVMAGNKLPDFLPDYLVYDTRTTRTRQRLATGQNRPLAIGYFDEHWRLPSAGPREGGDPDAPDPEAALLSVPPAPPVPAAPRRFLAPASDPAGAVARTIARTVKRFQNFRALVPGATWSERRRSNWSIRPQEECYQSLRDVGVAFRPIFEHPTPVPSPVEILGPVEGIWFRMIHEDRTLAMSCEMATRLPSLARILRRRGVRGADVMSAYRTHPRASFHTMGLGLDLSRFWTDQGWVSVEQHFIETPEHETCEAPAPETRRGRLLLRIACDLSRSGLFSSVLTPNYNEGHRDHFHIDARPDDPRLFLR